MRIGILGSGLMGGKLGTLFARAADVLLLPCTGPGSRTDRGRIEDVLSQAGDVSGKMIVTCSLPMNAEDTELVVAHTTSGAEELARRVPEARVVSAFGTEPSEVLFAVFEARDDAQRPSMVYCGDDEDATEVAAELIRDVGSALADRFVRFEEA